MTQAEEAHHLLESMKDGELNISLHSSCVLLDNAGKLLQVFCMFSNSLAVYRYTSDPQSGCL